MLFVYIEPYGLTTEQSLHFNLVVLFTFVGYTRSWLTDPGRVPPGWQPKNKAHRSRWCRKCEAPKPMRAHHCKTCGRWEDMQELYRTNGRLGVSQGWTIIAHGLSIVFPKELCHIFFAFLYTESGLWFCLKSILLEEWLSCGAIGIFLASGYLLDLSYCLCLLVSRTISPSHGQSICFDAYQHVHPVCHWSPAHSIFVVIVH